MTRRFHMATTPEIIEKLARESEQASIIFKLEDLQSQGKTLEEAIKLLKENKKIYQ